MQDTRQRHLSLPEELWKWIYSNHRKFGYEFPSWLIKDCITYAVKNNPRFKNPNDDIVKELEKFDKIGEIAMERRGVKFSIVHAVDDFEDDKKGLNKALKKGWITQEQYNEGLEKSEKQHKEVVRIELSKIHGEKLAEKSAEEIKAEFRANLKRQKEMVIEGLACGKCGSTNTKKTEFSSGLILHTCRDCGAEKIIKNEGGR